MKFQRVLMLTGSAAWMISAAHSAEAPRSLLPPGGRPESADPTKESTAKPPAKPLAELIGDLADPDFRTREEASRAIWGIGETALSDLKNVAKAKDPEQAFRARELIRKIQLFVTPETDAEVIKIVERYEKGQLSEKLELFSQLHQKRAWRQMLKLYASETNGQVRSQLQAQGSIEGIPVIAARECLRRGDVTGAREFLEMAPATAAGLLSLAEFHRSQGTFDQELKRAKTLEGKQGAAWRLALYRAAGDLEAARAAATEAGEPAISAAMSVLTGDPLPWLRHESRVNELRGSRKIYTELAIKRWQGSSLRPSDLEPLVKAVNSRNRSDRNGATGVLLLLGDAAPAEKSIVKHTPLEAFAYFEAQERIPEALKSLGLDPAKPDYENWVLERFEKLTDLSEEDEEDSMQEHDMELIAIAGFLERRGLHETCAAAFTTPLESLAAKDEEVFIDFLSSLFLNGKRIGAPDFACRFAAAWAGEDDERWDRIIPAIFLDREEMISLWDWLAELDPKATRPERLEGMLALWGIGTDKGNVREKWQRLAWEAFGQAAEDNRQQLLGKLMFMVSLSPDAAASLKLWEQLPEQNRNQFFWQAHAMNLSAAERWDDVAAFYLKYIDRVAQMNLDPQPEWHASVAAALRLAGHPQEAAKHDALVEKLALGRDALAIGGSYAFGHDYQRAAVWWTRAARQCDPEGEEFEPALELVESLLMDQGRWKEAAAISEARARNFAAVDVSESSETMLKVRGLRLQSDLARALSNLKEDRAGAIALLENCHRLFPNDAGLADFFFPAVRKAGLIKEHDAWFRTSWDHMVAIVDEFPDADNTANSAGWLASRARRNLDEAEALLEKALAMKPEQPAYLDTMAEIQFARGNRAKALEWSAKAINFSPSEEIFRRQHERFRSAPLGP